jgi:hypothetical protein
MPGWLITLFVIALSVLPVIVAEIIRRHRLKERDVPGFEVIWNRDRGGA